MAGTNTGASNQWMLFGVDLRQIGQQWSGAWRDLLVATSSPLRQRFDEPVALRRNDDTVVVHGGQLRTEASPERVALEAVLIPDELLLARTITLPSAAEAELPAVVTMEVASASPFAQDDTVFGWEEQSRDEHSVTILLAIASRQAITDWLRELVDSADVSATDAGIENLPEVWADVHGTLVCLHGFGEAARERLYRQRLVRVGLIAAGCLMMLLLIASLFAIQQRSSLARLESLQNVVQRESAHVAEMRETLVSANETILAANEIIGEYPNPHVEVARLTDALSDQVFLAHFSMRGSELRVRGRAVDAAMVMQTLAETPAYETVTAPQAITAVGNTGLEQFHLDIDLRSVAKGREDDAP